MIEKNYKESYTLWQDGPEDGAPEQAILIESYTDSIRLSQRGSSVLINYESVDEFCKKLKQLKKERK